MSKSVSKSFLQLVADEPPPCTEVEPETFFPNYGASDEFLIRLAKRVCAKCPIITECLEFALETGDQHAVLGGTTPAQRDRIRKRRELRDEREARRAA